MPPSGVSQPLAPMLGSLDLQTAISRALVDHSTDAVVAVDGRGRILLWNEAARTLFGHGAEDVLGLSLDVIIPEAMRGEHAAGMQRILEGGAARLIGKVVDVQARHANGDDFPIEMRICLLPADGAGETRFGAIIRDASQRRMADERLHNLAHFDQLTMLPNRGAFIDRLEDALRRQRDATAAVVVVLDLDGFDDANDSHGSAKCDEMLRELAVRLKRVAQATKKADATVARVGSKKFAAALPGSSDYFAAISLAEAFRDAVKGLAEQQDMGVTASVGIAVAPTHGSTATKLLANADFAMRRARADGGDRRQFFEPAQREAHIARRDLELELRRALAQNEFELHFQPLVRLNDGAVTGAEALLRWRHPERGLLSPVAFMHALKDSRLAEPVGSLVLHEACMLAARWRSLSGRPFRLGVNLFERQFSNIMLPRQVSAALEASGLPAEDLELEIVETIMTGVDEGSIRRVRRLREIGVGIALDDFGTGYASLSMLKRYPITRLKIDRSFVRDIVSSQHDVAIVDMVLALGRRFGFEVVAEGVETPNQAARLIELGCHVGQGYLFGKPVPAQEFERALGRPAAPELVSSKIAAA